MQDEPLDIFVVTHYSATQPPALVDLKRDLASAQRRATHSAGRPLAFEQVAPDVWEARGANKRIYRVERRQI